MTPMRRWERFCTRSASLHRCSSFSRGCLRKLIRPDVAAQAHAAASLPGKHSERI